jgi:hypothetical protein
MVTQWQQFDMAEHVGQMGVMAGEISQQGGCRGHGKHRIDTFHDGARRAP